MEDQAVAVAELLEVGQKVRRHVGPVALRVDVVGHVVAVVERLLVLEPVDQLHGEVAVEFVALQFLRDRRYIVVLKCFSI